MAKTRDEVQTYYQSRLQDFTAKLEEIKTTIRKTSILRIIIFLLTILGIYLASAYGWLPMLVIGVVGFSAFIFLVIRHTKLFKKRQWFEALAAINQTELDVL